MHLDNKLEQPVRFWFGFKQYGGTSVLCGPYTTREEAHGEREKAKAVDCQVSVPFPAVTREEAETEVGKYI